MALSDYKELSVVGKATRFVGEDHRFVFLGTSVLCAASVWLSAGRYALDFSAPVLITVARVICVMWVLVSLFAGLYKIRDWDGYETDSPFVQEGLREKIRFASYIAWAAALVLLFDKFFLGIAEDWARAGALDSNPRDDFALSAMYMIQQQQAIMVNGIVTTIRLAFFGTVIAFFLSLILVFLRIQEIDRSDNYLVRLLKVCGNGFASIYSSIIRGTPMMVQGLVIYYTGFNLMKLTGLPTVEIQKIWSFFVAGLTTMSLCSAAYMAEVLRASIEAIDAGQMEAARSLGLSQWQGMREVVFPQGIKNAVPALSNELIINIKDSSVLSVIGVFDLMYATTSVSGIYFRQMELYVATAIIYLILTFVAGQFLNLLSLRRGGRVRSILRSDNMAAVETELVTNMQ